MRSNRSAKEIQEWILALEAERFDLSYRRPRSKDLSVDVPETPIRPIAPIKRNRANARRVEETYKAERDPLDVIRERAARDRLVYNAGRYAAGARDQEAIAAFKQYQTKGVA